MRATVEVPTENHQESFGQYFECAQIKYLVVQRAHCYAVGNLVRAIGLKPLDVRSLQPDRLLPQPKVVTIYRTTVLVGQQNLGPKGRIPPTL